MKSEWGTAVYTLGTALPRENAELAKFMDAAKADIS